MATGQSSGTPTRWTLILRAQGSGAEGRAALGELVKQYERFIVWLIRRYRHPPDVTAEDLKQEFLVGLLRRDDIGKLDRSRGSFRGWLRTSVERFLWNEWDKWKTSSSGRRITDAMLFEGFHTSTPEEDACTRAFAAEVVLHVLAVQRAEARDPERFDRLVRFLPGPQLDLVELGPYARSIGMSRTALARAICLMRARFRELLRTTVGDTLYLDPEPGEPSSPHASKAIEDELRSLLRCFEGGQVAGVLLENP